MLSWLGVIMGEEEDHKVESSLFEWVGKVAPTALMALLSTLFVTYTSRIDKIDEKLEKLTDKFQSFAVEQARAADSTNLDKILNNLAEEVRELRRQQSFPPRKSDLPSGFTPGILRDEHKG